MTPPDRGSSSSFDPDIPRYDPDTRSFYGDPRASADKFSDSWEANAFREGKYPDPTTCIAGHLAPDCPKTQPSYAKAALSGAPKGKKNRSSRTGAKVTSATNSVPATQAPKSLPTAERRFYAPRSSPSEHPQAAQIAATFPDIAARVLSDAKCILLLAVTTKVKDRGSVTLLVTDPATPAAAWHLTLMPCPANSTSHSEWESPPGGPSASPPMKPSSPCTHSPSPSFRRTKTNSSPASPSRFSTPRPLESSPPGTSTRVHNLGRASLPPVSSSQSTLGTSQQRALPSVSFPAHARLSAPTPPIGKAMQELLGIGPCRPQVSLFQPRLPHLLPQPHPWHAPVPQSHLPSRWQP